MALRTMVIDGNFLMHRFARNYDFLKFPEQDSINYKIDLCNHIACEIERVSGFVDNFVLVRDSRSWRKDINQITSINENTGLIEVAKNYKENRVGAPKEARNDELLFKSFAEFAECLHQDFNMPMTQVYGAEGDDAIWAWTKYLRENNIFSCVYCSDSDIIQTVTPSNAIIRRVKSKTSQDGEIVIHPKLWEGMNEFKNDPFNFNPLKWQHENIMIGNRTTESGLRIENPNWTKLKLIVLGSGKDNVSETFTWPSNNGSQTRHINEKHIIAALEKLNMPISSINEQLLYDDSFLIELFLGIVNEARPKNMNDNIKILFESFISNSNSYLMKMHSNREMGLLNIREIPEKVQSDLLDNIKIQSTRLADLKSLSNSQNICDALCVTKNKMFQNLMQDSNFAINPNFYSTKTNN